MQASISNHTANKFTISAADIQGSFNAIAGVNLSTMTSKSSVKKGESILDHHLHIPPNKIVVPKESTEPLLKVSAQCCWTANYHLRTGVLLLMHLYMSKTGHHMPNFIDLHHTNNGFGNYQTWPIFMSLATNVTFMYPKKSERPWALVISFYQKPEKWSLLAIQKPRKHGNVMIQ